MKRLSRKMLLLLVILFLGLSFSCSKDDGNDEPEPQLPSITIISPSSGSATVYPGQEIAIAISAKSNSQSNSTLTGFTLTRTLADAGPVIEMDSTLDAKEFEITGLIIKASELNGQEVWTSKVTDKSGESAEASFTLSIEGVAPDFTPQLDLKTGTHSSGNPYVYEDITLQVNLPIVLGIIAESNQESNAKLTHLRIERIYEQVSTSVAYNEDIDTYALDLDVTTITYPITGDELWRIILTDEDGEQSIKEFTITNVITDPGIYIVNNISLGSYASTISGVLDADFGVKYTLTEANDDTEIQARIDCIYYEGAVAGHTLMSPANEDLAIVFPSIDNWTNRRDTKIGKTTLGVTAFNQITDLSQLIVLIQGQLLSGDLDLSENYYSENSATPGGFETGDIFAFETEAGNYGLIRITEINENASNGESFIKIDLKVEK